MKLWQTLQIFSTGIEYKYIVIQPRDEQTVKFQSESSPDPIKLNPIQS